MKKFQASILGAIFVLLLTFILGAALSTILLFEWDMKVGETVALLVALGAFISSFYHFYTQRKHQRLSVKPYFQLTSQFDSVTKEGFYTFRVCLKNTGLGPGKVVSKVMKLGGVETTDLHDEYEEWVRLVNRITPANGSAECRSGRCEKGYGIDKGENIDLLLVNFPAQNMSFMDARDIVMELSRHVSIAIEYESMYGEPLQCSKNIT